MEDPKNQAKQIQVKTGDEMSRGRFSNSMFITHSPEEFIIDWMLSSPTGTHLISRIIVTPAHVKRIIAALSENLKKYEEKFGEVRPTAPGEHVFH